MNKSQTVLAAIGGTVVVGALVLGYFIWDASSVKTEKSEALDGNVASAKAVMKKLPVKPEEAALSVYADNVAAYDDWRAEAGKLAARGDLVFESTTPAEFKSAIVGEARKIAALPGCFGGKFVKPDFGFGFKDYATGGAMPPEQDLKRLQREWNDVATVLKTIAECGGANAGVSDVRMGKPKAAAEEEQPKADKKKTRKKPLKKKVAKAKDAEANAEGPAITSFSVDFMVRPSGLVKALNAFATDMRFIVVESCTFARESDALALALGGDAKKDQPSARSGRGRRGRAQQPQETKADEVKKGFAADPATAPLLKVTMVVSVYDFGSLSKAEAEGKAEEAEEGEKK